MTVPTVSDIKQAIAGGFDRVDAMLLAADGYAIGTAPTLAPGASGSGSYRILGGKTAAINIPKPDVVYATGDDVPQGSLMFAAATLPNFELAVAVADRAFEALVQNISNYLMGNVLMSLLQPSDFNLADVSLICQRRAKAKGGSINNVSMWEGVIIPKCNIYPLGAKDITERKIADFGYWIITNPTDILPNGQDIPTQFSTLTTAPVIPFTSPNRLKQYAWIGDGTVTVFDLPLPSVSTPNGIKLVDSTLNTGSNGGRNTVTNEGVLVTAGLTIDSTVNPQTLTFSVAPAAGHRIELFAESL